MSEIVGNDPVIQTTRKGNPIPLEAGLFETKQAIEQSLSQTNIWIEKAYRNSPHKPRLRKPPTALYNCHGMTFLMRRAHLLADNAIEQVLAEDDYYEVNENNLCPGDVVTYEERGLFGRPREFAHSAIVTRIDEPSNLTGLELRTRTIWVLSKWGAASEFEHPHDLCPYPLEDIKFWREGKNDEVIDLRQYRKW